MTMIENTTNHSDVLDVRELSLDEIEATSGAGILRFIKCLFGGCGPKEEWRGPIKGDPKK
jgi:hypothetical protein